MVNITFADAVVDPDDVETLQDMTVQALNDALGQIDEATKNQWVPLPVNCHSKNEKESRGSFFSINNSVITYKRLGQEIQVF